MVFCLVDDRGIFVNDVINILQYEAQLDEHIKLHSKKKLLVCIVIFIHELER